MELYTVDETNSFRRQKLIEHYESFIWTDRYSAYGDFQLVCEPSQEMYDRLQPNVLVGFTESDRLMRIESILRTTDSKGKNSFKIEGKSVEAVLEGRAAKKVLSAATWDIVGGNMGAIVANMVNTVCVLGTGVLADDIVPGMTVVNLATTDPNNYTVKIKAGTLYERAKELLDTFDLGMRITFATGVNELKFAVYEGTDRTGEGGVAFSPSLENLSDTNFLNSWANYKTGAYIFSNGANALVGTTGDAGLMGLKRRILLVDATDVPAPYDAAHVLAIQQRGRDALSEHQRDILYDGKVSAEGPYKYNEHYFLGDKVKLVSDFGAKQNVRVTEHIWAYDRTGLNSYPTLRAIGGV